MSEWIHATHHSLTLVATPTLAGPAVPPYLELSPRVLLVLVIFLFLVLSN